VTNLKNPPRRVKESAGPDKLYVDNETAAAYFSFDTDFNLIDPKHLAQFSANSARSSHLMQLNLGNGRVTVITDSDLWKNPAIGKYDNAWLLWYLSQGTAVTLLFNSDVDDLFTLLLRYFPRLWWRSSACSPWDSGAPACAKGLSSLPPPRLADNCWNTSRPALTFCCATAARARCCRPAARYPAHRPAAASGFEHLDNTEQWRVLEHLTRQPSHVISQALGPLPAKRLSSADFSRQVACLQTLRNAL
jgi:hypothetical protein